MTALCIKAGVTSSCAHSTTDEGVWMNTETSCILYVFKSSVLRLNRLLKLVMLILLVLKYNSLTVVQCSVCVWSVCG